MTLEGPNCMTRFKQPVIAEHKLVFTRGPGGMHHSRWCIVCLRIYLLHLILAMGGGLGTVKEKNTCYKVLTL